MNDTAKRARASVPEYPMRAPLLQWRSGLAQLRIDAHADQIADAAHREHCRMTTGRC